jgi:hypothetical protein
MKTRHRTLVILLPLAGILLAAAVYQYGIVEVHDRMETIRELQNAKTKTLHKYISFIGRKPELEKRLAALQEARKADEGKIMEGETASLAAANLQNRLKGIITGRGGTISSERAEKSGGRDKLKVVTVSLDAVLPDTRSLSEILYAIETHAPYLSINEMESRVRNFKEPRELVLRLKVSALTAAR